MGAGGSNSKARDELIAPVKAKNVAGLNDAVTRHKPSSAMLNSLLHLAVQVSNAAIMARLVELGADPASIVEDPFSSAIGPYNGGKGTTLLHKAALYANVEVFKIILEKYPKLNINATCTLTRSLDPPIEGVTPLYCLLVATGFKGEDERTALVNLIMEKGANLEAEFMPDKWTAIYVATDLLRPCARFIAASRADTKRTDKMGRTVFHIFGRAHARLVANYLANHIRDLRDIYQYFDKEAELGSLYARLMDVNAQDSEGNTVYHNACEIWSHTLFNIAMKLSYTDHYETWKLTSTFRFFINPATGTKFDIKNKAGLTGDEVIQKGIGYLKANKEREAKFGAKK